MATLTTGDALRLAFLDGPGYGAGLVQRLRRRDPGLRGLRSGTVYPTLRALERAGELTHWTVVPGRRRGARARVYYELTAKGLERAERLRASLLRLLRANAAARPGAGAKGSTTDAQRQLEHMRERIRRCAEASEFVLGLRARVRESGRAV